MGQNSGDDSSPIFRTASTVQK